MNKPLAYWIIALSIVGVLVACTPPTTEQITVRETPTVEPELANPDEEILADCFQSATALAWLDENGDGVWDDGEMPLSGIEFVLNPTAYSRTTSDENGVADIFATTPGGNCAESLTIAAVRYDGYLLTTPGVVANVDLAQEYAFGFQPETAVSPSSNILVPGAAGLELSPAWTVTAVNYLFTRIGEGRPAYEFEQMELANGGFSHANGSDVTGQVESFLASLTGLEPVDEVRRTNY